MKKYIIWGIVVGIFLSIVNSIVGGVPGAFIFVYPIYWMTLILKCTGEGCWGPMIIFGDFLFFIISFLVALVIGYFKIKST